MAKKEIDIEKYATGLLDTLLESPDRFDLEVVDFEGVEVVALTCGKKIVAVITPEGLDTIDKVIDASIEDLDEEEEDDADDAEETYGKVVEGRVVRRAEKKPGWKP